MLRTGVNAEGIGIASVSCESYETVVLSPGFGSTGVGITIVVSVSITFQVSFVVGGIDMIFSSRPGSAVGNASKFIEL